MAHAHFATLARDPEVIERYLYDHTEVVGVEAPADLHKGTVIVHLRTTGRFEVDAIRLAQGQAARLNSGLYPTTEVFLSSRAGLTAWSQ